jgi:uncharacterized protein YbaP (TraB family)
MQIPGAHPRRLAGIALCIAALAAASLTAAQTSTPGGKSFLWKVQSGSKFVYLAGSVHALSADVYPLSPAFEQAFGASGTLVEEIDLGESEIMTAAPAILAKGMFLDGRRFDTVVSKETVALVTARLKDSGLPVEMFQAMKPWMVMLTIAALEAQKAGLDPTLGLDKHFYDRAKAAGKAVIGLETAESQIDRLDSMSADLQEQMLRSSLSEADTTRNSLKTIVSAWRRGDSASLEKTLLSDFTQYPAAYHSLIVERNNNWVPQIDACLAKSQPCLVVVGAAHLVGPDGLLTLFQRKGYKIEQQ